jgi:hypothetical protein
MKYIFLLLVLLPMVAFAQPQPSSPPLPEVQAVGGKLMEEIDSNIMLRTQLIKMQTQLKAAQDENAKLKAATKAEAPKPPEPAKK